MVCTKLFRYLTVLSVSVLLELGITPNFHLITQAQIEIPSYIKSKRVIFKPNPDQPAPEITTGAGKRNDGRCFQDQSIEDDATVSHSLTVLVPTVLVSPEFQESELSPVGVNFQLTVSEQPTFLVYVPPTSANFLELRVEDDQSQQIGETVRLNLTDTPGIYSISVPETAPPLDIGKDYKWLVSMTCQAGDPNDPLVEGLVRRTLPDSSLTRSLDSVEDLDKVAVYAEAGIWQDAVVTLAALRQTQPNNPDVVSAWENLLKYAELEDMVHAPLISSFEDIHIGENKAEGRKDREE
ncbi:MAG: DUF928 domain-containing protein [Coleofasciculus sp. C1-SOL-03]